MPRPPRDMTPIESATPSDARTPTIEQAAPLPKPPAPPTPRPPRLPPPSPGAPAKPGARSDTPSDMQMTRRIPRVTDRRDQTPAPLPPSPGARDAERWFEQVPTNPAHVAELADKSGSYRKTKASEKIFLPSTGPAPLIERPWVLPSLIAAVALVIGMILGALLFGGSDDCDECPRCDAPAQLPKQ